MSNSLKLVILVLVIVVLAIGGYVYFKTDLLSGTPSTETSGDTDEISSLLNSMDQEQSEEGALIEANDASDAQSAVDDQLTNDLKQIDESVL